MMFWEGVLFIVVGIACFLCGMAFHNLLLRKAIKRLEEMDK